MIQLGDVTKINGAEIPPVDVITYGSPCQDVSIAGKRKGMSSELQGDEETTRSGLFFDSIRIIKEMRQHDEELRRTDELVRNARSWVRPRFTILENVPGIFSSNQGEDFRAVLEETIRVVEPEAPGIPVPKGGWPPEGMVCGDTWSIAWTVHDAQFHGVPQRRKRLSLVCDYGGMAAYKVLSLCYTPAGCGSEQVCPESESLSGDSEQSGETGQGTAGDSEESPFAAGL